MEDIIETTLTRNYATREDFLNAAAGSFSERRQTDNPYFGLMLQFETGSDPEQVRFARVQNMATVIHEASLLSAGKLVSSERNAESGEYEWAGKNMLAMLASGVRQAQDIERGTFELKRRQIEFNDEYVATYDQVAVSALRLSLIHI